MTPVEKPIDILTMVEIIGPHCHGANDTIGEFGLLEEYDSQGNYRVGFIPSQGALLKSSFPRSSIRDAKESPMLKRSEMDVQKANCDPLFTLAMNTIRQAVVLLEMIETCGHAKIGFDFWIENRNAFLRRLKR